MPPAPENKGPQGEIPKKPQSADIDLDKILLPKKEIPGHTPQSAQRINAGALFEQEQTATLRPDVPLQAEPVKPAPPAPPKEEVQAVETYQGDIEKLVKQKNVSVVSIAAAEATRKEALPKAPVPPSDTSLLLKRSAIIVGALFFCFGAVTILVFAFFRPAPSVSIPKQPEAPFILVDDTQSIVFKQEQFTHTVVLKALQDKKEKSSLSLGLMSRFYLGVAVPIDNKVTYTLVPASELLSVLAPNMPEALLRSVSNNPYLLGFHAFDGNQAYLIVKVDSYEQAFSGMLSWEAAISRDLSPLFTRKVRPHIPEEKIATSSIATTTTIQLLPTGFVDRVVENHDSRVIQNETGDILLLWTFLDKDTLVITTNEYTLREIISRLTNAPITPL